MSPGLNSITNFSIILLKLFRKAFFSLFGQELKHYENDQR